MDEWLRFGGCLESIVYDLNFWRSGFFFLEVRFRFGIGWGFFESDTFCIFGCVCGLVSVFSDE